VTIGSASNAKLGKRVTVDGQGRTLYALGGESPGHLLCTSAECLQLWPPVKASSKKAKLKDGAGVQGKLGILVRHGGILQVTLRGKPLYRYAGDRARGEANGEGIVFPGGHVWHAVTATASATGNSAPMTSTPAPNPAPAPGYSTPGY
jgi:predicted lipoprotein with Yx(FWY)xxD motif